MEKKVPPEIQSEGEAIPAYLIRSLRVPPGAPHYLDHDLLALLDKMKRQGFRYVDGMAGPMKHGRNVAGDEYTYIPILFRREEE